MKVLLTKDYLEIDTSYDIIKIKLSDIKFIGEYTNGNGPFEDDWFFVFGLNQDKYYQISSMYIDHEKFWEELGALLNYKIAPKLFAYTKWKTVILYPSSIEDEELFELVKVRVPDDERIWVDRVFGINKYTKEAVLSGSIKSLFQTK